LAINEKVGVLLDASDRRRSYAYRRAVALFKRLLDIVDDLSLRYIIYALELATSRLDPAPLYHFLSFIESESVFQKTEVALRETPFKSYPTSSVFVLPSPSKERIPSQSARDSGAVEVPERASGSVSLQDLSDLLYHSAFPRRSSERKPALPYGSYVEQPVVEFYLHATIDGPLKGKLFHYLPSAHALELLKDEDLSKDFRIATRDSSFERAPLVFVLTVRYGEVLATKFNRAYRISLMEAGSALSTFLSTASSIGLRPKACLDFMDRLVCRLLELDCYEEFPFALVAIS